MFLRIEDYCCLKSLLADSSLGFMIIFHLVPPGPQHHKCAIDFCLKSFACECNDNKIAAMNPKWNRTDHQPIKLMCLSMDSPSKKKRKTKLMNFLVFTSLRLSHLRKEFILQITAIYVTFSPNCNANNSIRLTEYRC